MNVGEKILAALERIETELKAVKAKVEKIEKDLSADLDLDKEE